MHWLRTAAISQNGRWRKYEESGKHFDPKLTRLFIENFDKFVAIKEEIDGMR